MAFLLDTLLTAPVRFVLDKIVDAVNAELDDEGRLKEDLLAAQMRLELGEIGDEEFAAIESQLLARLREIRQARGEAQGVTMNSRVVGADVSFDDDSG
jgi:hypothetical protein